MTVEDRLERLAGRTPPGDPTEIMAAARARAESGTDNRSRTLLAAAAAVLAVVAFAAGGFALLGNDGDDAVTVAGPNGADTESQLTVPESGALPQQLADGTPVWVVRHADGSVSVVDAVSTHRPFGAGTLVGWCESSRGFLDPMYGSQYDEHGRKQAGPAPRGLDKYPVASLDGDTVTVTAVQQPRAAEGGPEASEPAGPQCFHTGGDDNPGVIEGSFQSHPVASAAPATPEDAKREPDGTLVVVDARVLVVKGQEALVCTSEVTGPPPSCDGIPAPELFVQDEIPVVMHGVFVARPNAETLTDIAYVGERNVVEARPGPGTGQASVVREPVLPGFVPDGYRLAWVDTPTVPPVGSDRFALHERPHHYAYGYQKAGVAELEVRVMVGASIGDPEAVADEWNSLAAPTALGGRPAIGYPDGGRLLVEVDGGVAMITTHPLGEPPPDGRNPAMPSREDVDRFAGSISAVSAADWDAALSSSGADVASTFGPKGGAALIDGDGWSLVHGEFRAPLSVRSPAAWVDFGGTPGTAVGEASFEAGGWYAEISVHEDTRVAWGVVPAGTAAVKVTVSGETFDATLDRLPWGATVFAVDVSGAAGNGTFGAFDESGHRVADGPVEAHVELVDPGP